MNGNSAVKGKGRLIVEVTNMSPNGVKICIDGLKEVIDEFISENMLKGCVDVRTGGLMLEVPEQ
jgi:hypothetical protein